MSVPNRLGSLPSCSGVSQPSRRGPLLAPRVRKRRIVAGLTHWPPGTDAVPQPDLGIARQVHSGGEDAGMARGAAEHDGVGVIDLTLYRLTAPQGGGHRPASRRPGSGR